MTPFAYATPHSNTPYVEGSRQRSVGIWVDDDEEEDDTDVGRRGQGVRDRNERGSVTDIDLDDGEEGYDENALSDFETESGPEDQSGRRLDDEWEGVQDYEQEHSTGYQVHTTTTITTKVLGLRREAATQGDDDNLDDQQSNASSSPSEYPSTQQQQLKSETSDQGNYSRSEPKMVFRIHVDDDEGGESQ